MKRTNKLISLLLALVLASSLCAAAFAADDDVVLSGNAGETVSWTLTKDGVLTVSGSGPILDKTEEETDEDGVVCISTYDSIQMTFDRYYIELVEGKTAEEAARIRLELVKEIVVEEGVTAIPQNEFAGMYPEKVTLPATLEEIGYDAFDLMLTSAFELRSVKLPELDIRVPAYESGAEPYADAAAARAAYIENAAAQEAYDYALIPFDALRTYADVYFNGEEAYWNEMDEAEKQEVYAIYNSYLGTNASELADFVPAAIAKLNEQYGKSYTGIEDIFSAVTDEDGNREIVTEPDLQATMDEEADAVYYDRAMTAKPLYAEEDFRVAYGWFTLTAPAGGKIEADCKACGVTFSALPGVSVPPEEPENACPFCGKDHSANLWQKFIGFLHKICYFFAHLFGLK